MRKVILPILLFLLLLFPLPAFAQATRDSCFGQAYRECNPVGQECSSSCGSNEKNYVAWAECNDACGEEEKNCFDKVYEKCMKGGVASTVRKPTVAPTTSENDTPADETACHESCQSDYDNCTSQCKSVGSDPRAVAFQRWLKCTQARGLPKSKEDVAKWEREDQDPNSPCYSGVKKSDSSNDTSNETCLTACEQTKRTCDQRCREAGQTVNTNKPEKPSVGLSSNNFKGLARANAEYEVAKASLEKLKQDNDPRFEAKKDFASDYNQAIKDMSGGDDDSLKALRSTLEEMHDIASKGKDWQEFEQTLESVKKGEFGSYGKLDLFTDTVKSFNDYQDLRATGISANDAATKAALDNYGSSALNLIPVLKAIDLVATTPDSLLNAFGVNMENWSRKYVTDGFIGKFAPSGVVKQTTDLMVQDNWSDIGNALKFGWNKVQAAEGWADTITESEKLLAAALGAVPVSIGRGISDLVGGGLSIGEKASDLVSGLFTR